MKISLWSGLLGMEISYFTKRFITLKRFIYLIQHHVEPNIYTIKWAEYTNKWKLQWPSWPSPTSSGVLHILASSLSSGSFPSPWEVLPLHFSIFPNNPARSTYNPQTFTVNSESRTVRLSGAVTVTSNFGNTRTKNKKEKNQHWHNVNLQTLLRWKKKWGYILLLVIEGVGSQNWGGNMIKNWPDLKRLTEVFLQHLKRRQDFWTSPVMSRCLAELWKRKFMKITGKNLVCLTEIWDQFADFLCRLFCWLSVWKIVIFSWVF